MLKYEGRQWCKNYENGGWLWKLLGLCFDLWLDSLRAMLDRWGVEAVCRSSQRSSQCLWRCKDEDWCTSCWKQLDCLCYCHTQWSLQFVSCGFYWGISLKKLCNFLFCVVIIMLWCRFFFLFKSWYFNFPNYQCNEVSTFLFDPCPL